MRSLSTAMILIASTLLACAGSDWAPADPDAPASGAVAVAPLLGVPDGGDAADRGCNIVLRTLSRVPNNTGGYLTDCQPGGACWYVWEGTLDLSGEAVESGTPTVLYQTGAGDQAWRTATVTALETTDGTHRYKVRMDRNTVPDGMSTTSLMNTRIQVAPALVLTAGGRLFDHNRNAGDFDNYVLDASNGWTVKDDAAACPATPPRATVRFLGDWTEVRHGAIVAGGRLDVDYETWRLTACANAPAWVVNGHARFLPSGELASGPVVSSPDGMAVKVPWEIAVPAGSTAVELWFETSGEGCASSWDSNFGANYAFPVAAAPTPYAVKWAGDWGMMVARGCDAGDRQEFVPEPWVYDSWTLTRAACKWVEVDVYAAGLTDGATERSELLLAQVEWRRDNGEAQHSWLSYQGRAGNNYRFRWDLSASGVDMIYTPWDTIAYALRFSTDGNDWFRVGQQGGPDGGADRTITRAPDWCPSGYWGEDKCP